MKSSWSVQKDCGSSRSKLCSTRATKWLSSGWDACMECPRDNWREKRAETRDALRPAALTAPARAGDKRTRRTPPGFPRHSRTPWRRRWRPRTPDRRTRWFLSSFQYLQAKARKIAGEAKLSACRMRVNEKFFTHLLKYFINNIK